MVLYLCAADVLQLSKDKVSVSQLKKVGGCSRRRLLAGEVTPLHACHVEAGERHVEGGPPCVHVHTQQVPSEARGGKG